MMCLKQTQSNKKRPEKSGRLNLKKVGILFA